MYEASRLLVRSRMRDDFGRWHRISAQEVHATLNAAGYDYSLSAVRKVLSGERVSRPLLRLASSAVLRLRDQRREAIPDWL